MWPDTNKSTSPLVFSAGRLLRSGGKQGAEARGIYRQAFVDIRLIDDENYGAGACKQPGIASCTAEVIRKNVFTL